MNEEQTSADKWAGIAAGGIDMASMYVNALKKNEDIDLPRQTGFSGMRDLRELNDMEFEKNPFNVGNVLKGAGTGASIGSAIPGIGTAIGAIGGGVLGAGASIIQAIKQKKAEQEFEKQKRENIQDAIHANAGISMRNHLMRNLGDASRSQLDILSRGIR